MKFRNLITIYIFLMSIGCTNNEELSIKVIESSAAGKRRELVKNFQNAETKASIIVNTEKQYQVITGIGGSFTEASAHILNNISPGNKEKIIKAYFGDEGARYSLTRTHINSCDFSLSNYAYANDPEDLSLNDFSINHDLESLIPFILEAQKISTDGFKIISSPWTAPPHMKDNKSWVGGKLLPQYYDSWALYFSKYLKAYKKEGIDIWGITVENEPLGNGNNWESMHYTAEEMTNFVNNHLGPKLESEGQDDIVILGYDQNRDHLKEWVDAMYKTGSEKTYFDGTAIHWYASTYDVFEEELEYAHQLAPEKYLIETEGCIDAEVPVWQDDDWYWSKEATDWGWDWAPEDEKHLHPKYVPTYRYARDIIGCLNNWVDGWVDWNMVLDRQGGPNWFKNWCIAPILVDTDTDEVYFTPLYDVMTHFSRYIRPGAIRLSSTTDTDGLHVVSVRNSDGTIAMVVLNENNKAIEMDLTIDQKKITLTIDQRAIQTILINNMERNKN